MAWLRSTNLVRGVVSPITDQFFVVPDGHRYVVLDMKWTLPAPATTLELVQVSAFLIGFTTWELNYYPIFVPGITNAWEKHWQGRLTLDAGERLILGGSYSGGMNVAVDGWDLLVPV